MVNDKQLAGLHAAELVKDQMRIGLGTGSTVNYFIEALAARVNAENLQISVAASSVISSIKAAQLGLKTIAIESIDSLDLYVDGADEVTPDLTLLKGRGQDLVKEKLLAQASGQFWVLIDSSKHVAKLGQNFPIPIEVMPWAWRIVQTQISRLGGLSRLRLNAGDNLAISAHGSLVLDTVFETDIDSNLLNQQLNAIPGVVEHGIFYGLAHTVYCGNDGIVEEYCRDRPPSSYF